VAEQRKRILAAARELLAERSAGEITAKDLADQAGVSRATFYRCFDNVDAVIDTLYNEFLTRVTGRLERHIQVGADPATWLRQLVGEVLGDAVEMGPYLVALHREELRPGSPARHAQQQRMDAQIEQICDWWESWAKVPADRDLVRAIVLLPQAAGISLARANVTADEKARLEDAVMFMIEATIERYVGFRKA
jgi:AcrR family transcriptional regulator